MVNSGDLWGYVFAFAAFASPASALADDPPEEADDGSWTVESAPDETDETEAEPAEVAVPLPAGYLGSDRKFLKPIPGADPPPGYVLGKRNRQGLWAGGIAVSAGTYVLSLFGAILSVAGDGGGRDQQKPVMFGTWPLVGPFIVAGFDGTDDVSRGVLIAGGLGQLAGFAMIVAGVSQRIPVWRRAPELGKTLAYVNLQPTGGGVAVEF